MTAVNKKKVAVAEVRKAAHVNFMGAPSYNIDSPILRLVCMSASSFFKEPMYYKGMAPEKTKLDSPVLRATLTDRQREHLVDVLNSVCDYAWRNMTPATAMVTAIREALDFDAERTLQWAAVLRNGEFIRTTPQIIMVEAANHSKTRGSGLVRKYATQIIRRADEPALQLAYQLEAFGKPIPNALKRSWSDFLEKADEYSLAKYRMESRAVKTVDVANVCKGKGYYGYQTAIGKLMRGELKLADKIETWESIISGGGSWEEAVKVMGHMALLRNVRNLVEARVDKGLWVDKLVATAEKGKQIPFRYLSAFNANEKAPGYVLDAIEKCFELSIDNLPKLPGRSLVLSDNSGSAHGCTVSELSTMTVAQIGNLMGVLTAKVSDEGVVGVFGDEIKYMEIRKGASTMDQARTANKLGATVGGGTENGIWLALDKAIHDRVHWDNIFVYSDMQAGHGGLYGKSGCAPGFRWDNSNRGRAEYIDVPKLINVYRSKVNSKVNVFLVQTAGYEDTIIPEFYNRTFIIGGWSGNVIKFARRMIDTFDNLK